MQYCRFPANAHGLLEENLQGRELKSLFLSFKYSFCFWFEPCSSKQPIVQIRQLAFAQAKITPPLFMPILNCCLMRPQTMAIMLTPRASYTDACPTAANDCT